MRMDMSRDNPAHTGHLDPERLAAFDDLSFTADERTHLAACAPCRAELDAVRAVVALAGEWGASAGDPAAPRLVEWESIAAGLRMPEGASEETARGNVPQPRRSMAPMLRRAAAVLLLVGGGAVLGRMSGEFAAARGQGATITAASALAMAESLALPTSGNGFASIEDATRVLGRAQYDYERASLWLAANDTSTHDSEVYRARLAALDQMMEASRAALRDAPQDPVLNQYYLAAYTAREATLQALGIVLPVDKTIERY
jgi:hypothetical protein